MTLLAFALAACAAGGAGVAERPEGTRAPIDHIIVLFLENRAFDHLFGTYPGAEGLAGYRGRQADKNGIAYGTLPAPLGRDGKPDSRFPADPPNAPFAMQKFVAPFDLTNNPIHRFYHMQRQYGAGADGLPMGKWVAEGTSGGTTIGYFDRFASPAQWKLADRAGAHYGVMLGRDELTRDVVGVKDLLGTNPQLEVPREQVAAWLLARREERET